jgi:hypothetical protein
MYRVHRKHVTVKIKLEIYDRGYDCAKTDRSTKRILVDGILLFLLTAKGYLPGGSGTTIRHNTQTTHSAQNNTTIKQNTTHQTTPTINILHRMNTTITTTTALVAKHFHTC